MKCVECNKQALVKFTGKWYCKKCFTKVYKTQKIDLKEKKEKDVITF